MSGTLHIFVVSPDTRSERRIEPYWTVQLLKDKLEVITGVPASNQRILLLESENNPTVLAQLSDNSRELSEYGLRDWQVLKVEDTNPSASLTGQLSDVSQVEKFELSDAEYARRQDSVLAYKMRNKVGRFAETREEEVPPPAAIDIPIGARCEVESMEPGLSKRGTVRFVGQTKFSKGTWVGIEYDEPFGKNDGSVQGERYFEGRQNYGVFVRPDKVKVGDFPVEVLNFDEDEEM
ncbi:Tubulin-folding cofactor B [Leucoagaricus sp. SymC.cos]|nr:Tubulin-folding cofactor B [Leucoagaricus sp. SymC.cos]